MKKTAFFLVSLLICLTLLISGCSSVTKRKSWSEETGPDGHKTTIQTESVVQVNHNSTGKLTMEHIKDFN